MSRPTHGIGEDVSMTWADDRPENKRATRIFWFVLLGIVIAIAAVTVQVVSDSGSKDEASSCVTAFEEAADIPAGDNANGPLLRTARECTSVDEWTRAFQDNPAAFGLADYPGAADLGLYLGTVCDGQSTTLCQEAARKGL